MFFPKEKKMDQEEIFEEKAKTLHAYLKTDLRYDMKFLPRPFFLELTGSPSAGKTTTIKELDKLFRRLGFRVLCPQEGAEVVRHISRTTPLYNLMTGDYALEILNNLGSGHQYDIVIFDRCLFDVYSWMMYWEGKGMLTEEEKVLYQSYFLSRFWLDKIDAAYFMISDPKVAMEREMRIALSTKLGETSNPKTIENLVERYKTAYAQLSPNHPQLTLLDTTEMDEQTMVKLVANQVLNALEQKTKNGS